MIQPKKSLGQHFLHDKGIISRIVAALDAQSGDRIFEIGPGPGALTKSLAAKDVQLVALDADQDMIDLLNADPQFQHAQLLLGDALTYDFDPILKPQSLVISNLPYQTSVPITARLMAYAEYVPRLVMMYQKEVAERIRAQPRTKAYGPISVFTQSQYRISKLMNLGPGAFKPPPKVQSQVLVFERLSEPLIAVCELPALRRLIEPLFQQRRKMITSVLRRQGDNGNFGNLLESFESLGFSMQSRPEELSVKDYADWLRAVIS